MTIHTDVPAAVTTHAITQKLLYQGSVHDVAEGFTEFARGGQVAVSPASFARLTLDPAKYYQSKSKLQALLAMSKLGAQRRDSIALNSRARVVR